MDLFWDYKCATSVPAHIARRVVALYEGHYPDNTQAYMALGKLFELVNRDNMSVMITHNVVHIENELGQQVIELVLKGH